MISLGEQPHDASGCHRGGQPHLGPCIDPVIAATVRPCVRCHELTTNWCQVCKKDMCHDCVTDHSHGLDGTWEAT